MEIAEMKKKIAQAVRVLSGAEILTFTTGHVSCRVPGQERIVVLGHAHAALRTLDTITEDDIVTVDFEGRLIEGKYKPAGEIFIHTELYRKRLEVGSIVHGHPLTSMAFGIAFKKMVPVYHRAIQFHPSVPIHDFWGQVDTPERGRKAAELMGSSLALILRGHGVIVAGETVEDAVSNAIYLERNARVQLNAAVLGEKNPKPLQPESPPHKVSSAWNYFLKKYDPFYRKEDEKQA